MKHTAAHLRDRLLAAGMTQPEIWDLIMPEWWSEECEDNPALMYELDIPVARLLECTLALVQDPNAALPEYQVSRGDRLRALRLQRNLERLRDREG